MKYLTLMACVAAVGWAQDDIFNRNGPGVCPDGGPSTSRKCDPKNPWPACPPQTYCYATNNVDIGPYYCCQVWSSVGAAIRPLGPLPQPATPAVQLPTARPQLPQQQVFQPRQPLQPQQQVFRPQQPVVSQWNAGANANTQTYYVYPTNAQPEQQQVYRPFIIPANANYLTSVAQSAAANPRPLQYNKVVRNTAGAAAYSLLMPPRVQRDRTAKDKQ